MRSKVSRTRCTPGTEVSATELEGFFLKSENFDCAQMGPVTINVVKQSRISRFM